MIIRKKTSRVLEFLRSQPQQVGDVRLLGIKVSLDKLDVASKVCAYIAKNDMPYDAHMKSDREAILSVWYKNLKPYVDSKADCTENLSEEVVELFRNQTKKKGDMQLLSIKVMLPEESDRDKISTYIVEKYPEYKVRSKQQGEYPIVAIGYKE